MAGYVVDGVQLTQEQAERIAAEVEQRKLAPFAVGDWVQHRTKPYAKARRIHHFDPSLSQAAYWVESLTNTTKYEFWEYAQELRHATTEEIAAAKQIEVKSGMLLKHNGKWGRTSRVMYWSTSDEVQLCDLSSWSVYRERREYITTDHYTVLDSYTIQGTK